MTKNQEWFDKNYPNKEREEEIRIEYENFQGQLIIKDCSKLRNIYLLGVCHIEKLTLKNLKNLQECTIRCCALDNLIIEDCPQIKKLNIRNNRLSKLDFLKFLSNSESLDLDISYNNFYPNNLDPFGKITKLCKLNISDSLRRKILFGKHNRFYGSLESLKDATKLEELDISNTNIDEGLEHLPDSLNMIACSADWIPLVERSKCSAIVQKLKNYQIEDSKYYNLAKWREHQPYHEYKEMLTQKEYEIDQLKLKLKQIELEKKQKEKELLKSLRRQSTLILQELKTIKSFTQPQESLIEKLIKQLKTENNLTSTEQEEIFTKLNELLGIKRMFINNRENVIESLRKCCDILEQANIGKYAKQEEVAKSISAAGKLVSKWTLVNVVEPVGEGIGVLNMRNKRKFAIKSSDIFQSFLTEEEKSLQLFKQVYNSLISSLKEFNNAEINKLIAEEQEPDLFSLRYKIYDIATNIWANKAHLETGDMKEAISLLQSNLLDLQDELKQQEQAISNITKQLTNQSQALVVQTPSFRY